MLFEAKSLSNLPIISLDSGKNLGFLNNIIIDPENGKIAGVVTQSIAFWKSPKALAFNDIYEFSIESIVVRDDESLSDISEVIRIKDIVKRKIYILGSKVVTEFGKNLGRVDDFIINVDLGILVKIYVESFLSKGYLKGNLIIPANKIILIEHKKITIKDDTLVEKASKQGVVEEVAST